jgi:hypothetical protein
MAQYLLSVYQPDGVLPDDELAKVVARLDVWREEVQAAGGWVFALGLHPAGTATVVRPKDGDVLLTDGPYVEGKEHIGGFTIVQADDLDAAIAWGAGLAEATGLPIEVRPMHG